jgi:hypothetical protein
MERRETVRVKSGREYAHLFPKAVLATSIQKESASVDDTLKFIPIVVRDTLQHTQKVAQLFKANTVYRTCQNIWQFIYDHIAYRKDEDGKEQIRSPARTWHDRLKGVDCDCYSTFISSILSNLGIKHVLRITKYKKNYFQHIYPIVPTEDGKYITIDCVVRHFDYEEPFTEKKDYQMNLEYLSGVNGSLSEDPELIGYDDEQAMSDLGKLFKKKATGGTAKKTLFKKQLLKKPLLKRPLIKKAALKKIGGKIKTVAKKALHVTNRLNPATALLRAGILASVKLNLFKISENLRYAYLSDAEAEKQGVDMSKFARLKAVKDRLEKAYYSAGGKPENLKKAILTGRGNRDHQVKGLGYLPDDMNGLGENDPISNLLGEAMMNDEFAGLGSLGEPATAATIAAASGIMGAIAGLLKNIGSIFKKKDEAGKAGGGSSGEGGSESGDEGGSDSGGDSTATDEGGGTVTVQNSGGSLTKESGDPDSSGAASSAFSAEGEVATGFWAKNKKWLLPASIGLGALAIYGIYKMSSKTKGPALSGFPKGKKKKNKIKSKKKDAIAFL